MEISSFSNQETLVPIAGSNWGEQKDWIWEGLYCHWRVLGGDNQKIILLIHGFGASSAHWRYTAAPLVKAGYRVYSLDLIGFGKSQQPDSRVIRKIDNRFWANQVGDFIENVINKSSNQKIIILGNSLGSLVGITTAVFRPDLVDAVIASPLPDPALVDSGFQIRLPFWTITKKIFIYLFFSILPLEIIVPIISKTKIIKWALQFAYHKSVKRDKDLQLLVSKPAQRQGASKVLRSMCIGMSLRPSKITAPALLQDLGRRVNKLPILLIWGRQDRLVPLKIGKQLSKNYPWIQLLVLEESGHCPHDESPDDFNQNVLKWLELNFGEH